MKPVSVTMRGGLLLAIGLALLCAHPAGAQKKWDGGARSSSWYDSANWAPDGVPVEGDSVLFDNSLKTISYTVVLPTGQSFVPIKQLHIKPDSGKSITVILPEGSIAPTGFRIGDYVPSTKDIIIERGGVLINNAGGDQGPGIQLHSPTNGMIEIRNGGRYIHRTKRPPDLATRLLDTPGSETGIFEYDVPFSIPDNDFWIPTNNVHYGSVIFRQSNLYRYYTDATSTAMTVRGDLSIYGTLQYDLGGILYIGGNLYLAGSLNFGAGAQTIELNGSTRQSVDASWSSIALKNLTFNNAAGFEIKKDITVDDTLKLLNGKVDMGLNLLQHGSSTEKTIQQIGTTSWIIGTLSRYINATTGNRLFPLGTTTDTRKVDLNFTTAPGSPGSLVMSIIPQPPGNDGLPLNDAGIVLVNIAPLYWVAEPISGLAGGTYSMTVRIDNVGGISRVDRVRLVKRLSGGNWVAQGTPGTNSPYTVTRDGMSGFSEFGLAGSSDNPLPVDVRAFTASISGEGVLLRWTVERESGVSGYLVERASGFEPDSWNVLGTVPGRGCCTVSQEYSFVDRTIDPTMPGTYGYRLRIRDYDGSETLSPVVKISYQPSNADAMLMQNYPNPVGSQGLTEIGYFIPSASRIRLAVFDALGREVALLTDEVMPQGFHEVRLKASSLPPGVYFYRLQANGASYMRKLLIRE